MLMLGSCLAKLGLKRSKYFLELMLLGHVLASALCVRVKQTAPAQLRRTLLAAYASHPCARYAFHIVCQPVLAYPHIILLWWLGVWGSS